MENKKKLKYCNNCGKFGHYSKKCSEPKTSLGIISISLDMDRFKKELIKKRILEGFYEIDSYNYLHLNNISKISKYAESVKFLMICRKHSLNYIEFLRGLYNIDNKFEIGEMFKLMTKDEVEKIFSEDFDKLWKDLWKKTSKSKMYNKEYKRSKRKFTELFSNDNILNYLKSLEIKYEEPEWGFPKGRRNGFESDIKCALREFSEETFIELSEDDIISNILPIDETYVGTNGHNYKSLYYLTLKLDQNEVVNDFCTIDNLEVSKIKWFTFSEAIKKIRPYYHFKIAVINKILMFFINLIESENNNYISFLN